jgi:hypothetical protein
LDERLDWAPVPEAAPLLIELPAFFSGLTEI